MNIKNFTSSMLKFFRPSKTKRKPYPTMVVSSPREIAKHNDAVEAGWITKTGRVRDTPKASRG